AAGLRAFYQIYAARFGKSRWGDKTPLYSRQMPEISGLLPEARFVHLIRDGRDVALSLKKVWFAPGQDMRTLAEYWSNLIQQTRAFGQQCPHYLEIRYEQLVRHPADELQRICDFLEIEYDSRMQQYHELAANRLAEMKGRYTPDGSVFISQEQRHHQQ